MQVRRGECCSMATTKQLRPRGVNNSRGLGGGRHAIQSRDFGSRFHEGREARGEFFVKQVGFFPAWIPSTERWLFVVIPVCGRQWKLFFFVCFRVVLLGHMTTKQSFLVGIVSLM